MWYDLLFKPRCEFNWWQTDVLSNREEEIHGGIFRASIRMYVATNFIVGLLWIYKTWSYSRRHSKYCGHCNGNHLCRLVSHLCIISTEKGQSSSSSPPSLFSLLWSWSSSAISFQVTTALLVALLDVGFLGVAVLVTHFAMNGDVRINVIGCLCAGLCIIMYASPLSIMVRYSC